MASLKESWLIQRLERPRTFKVQGKAVDNPFSFGGGYKNGGLTDEAMDLIRPIMSFDYMGAAEFEFGAVPETLSKIARQDDLVAWSFSVTKANRGWDKKRTSGPRTLAHRVGPSRLARRDRVSDPRVGCHPCGITEGVNHAWSSAAPGGRLRSRPLWLA